jgi:hypothetical protein
MTPFLTLYTPTYKRPQALQRCMASVESQTLINEIEHLIVPDYVGLGIGGMYQRVPSHAPAVNGRYVHFLADDDVLASPSVVEQVQQIAQDHGNPALILVRVIKGGLSLPGPEPWPPIEGAIDLGCMIVRSDVWKAHAHCYGNRYEGDADFAIALHKSGVREVYADLLFMVGAVMHGAAEPREVGPNKWAMA